jgi:hypothetical protein
MLGTTEDPGVMVLTLQKLFEEVTEHTSTVDTKVTISYLEVCFSSNVLVREFIFRFITKIFVTYWFQAETTLI